MQPQIRTVLDDLQRQLDALAGRLTGLIRVVQLFSGSVGPALTAALEGAGLQPGLSGSIDGHFNQLSGTVDARFTNLSGSINSAINSNGSIAALSGTVNARFVNLSGTVDGHFNQLSGTIDARFAGFSPTLPATVAFAGTAVNAGPFDGSNQNAFSHFTSGVSVVLCAATASGGFFLNGIANGTTGRCIALFNTGSANNISAQNNSISAGNPADRILTVSAATFIIPPGGAGFFWYDGSIGRWRTLSRT